MTAVTRLLALLGTRLPLIQAPMAGVQGAALAAAVCEAGALGSVPGATHTPDTLRAELTALRAATDRPWNVNFFCHTTPVFEPAREAAWRATLAPFHAEAGIDGSQVPPGAGRQPFSAALADALEPFAPRVVSFHFGLPDAALVARIKRWGSVVMSSATTVEEGLWLQQHGADVVIAQGLEAGGHRGHFLSDDLSRQMGLMALLPQLVAALDLPVVAAGGLADAAGVRAAMALGAAGVQTGTVWLCCPEATTSAVHRAALTGPDAAHTALTTAFTGRPARGIVNRAMRELGHLPATAPAFPTATAAMAPLRSHWEAQGRGDFTPLWAGQNTLGCRPVPAAEVVNTLAAGLTRGPDR